MENKNIFGFNKVFDHTDKLQTWLKKDKTLITVELDLTNKCNSKCPGCVGYKENAIEMTKEDAIKTIGQIIDCEVRGIIFTGGGEPLLHKDANDIISYANTSGLKVGLITNGLNINKEISQVIAKHCTWCRISLDAGTPKTYQKVHGLNEKMFNKVKENIKLLVSVKTELRSKCTIGIGYLTGKDTIEEMLTTTKLASTLGVDYIQFRPFHGDFTDIEKQYEECKKEEGPGFSVLASIQKYSFFKDKNKRPYKHCYGADFRTTITSDNNVYLCCHMRTNKDCLLGNTKKTPLIEIMNSTRKELVMEHLNFKYCPLFCINDKINRELENMVTYRDHKEFL